MAEFLWHCLLAAGGMALIATIVGVSLGVIRDFDMEGDDW